MKRKTRNTLSAKRKRGQSSGISNVRLFRPGVSVCIGVESVCRDMSGMFAPIESNTTK